MLKRLLTIAVGLIIVAAAGFAILSHRPAIDPISPPAASSFSADEVERGRLATAAGFCVTCHTEPGGKELAGGLSFKTPFGTLYSTNITPDPDTGIGRWSEAAFARAMSEGVRRDGKHLFPAFPFDHFTKVSDADVKAIYAYLMTRPAVHQEAPANTLPFPLNIRAFEWGWKLLSFRPGKFQPDPSKSAEWNRGAYLAEGLGHCSSCHSPRNLWQAEEQGDQRYNGNIIEGWYAPPLNASNPSSIPWTEQELYTFLKTGATALHGSAGGSMGHVTRQLAQLPDSDVHAIATYYADLDGSAQRHVDTQAVIKQALAKSASDTVRPADHGAQIFRAACASCHYNGGDEPQLMRPELALTTALNANNPNDLVMVILNGVSMPDGLPTAMMPGFKHALTDKDIADLATYLRRSRTDKGEWDDLPARIAELRKLSTEP